MFLTEDVGRTGFPLGIERVEALLKPLLCRLARIDGTALADHDFALSRSPKNFGPFRFVPVIARATADSEE